VTAPFAWRALQRHPDVWVARTVSLLGLGCLAVAIATIGLADESGAFLPLAWPPTFGLAGALCFATIAWPRSTRLYVAAGAVSVLAWASRSVAVVVLALNGQTIAPRAVIGVVAYITLAYFIAWYFAAVVAPWRARRRTELIARGA
jgi:hypothetical protein